MRRPDETVTLLSEGIDVTLDQISAGSLESNILSRMAAPTTLNGTVSNHTLLER